MDCFYKAFYSLLFPLRTVPEEHKHSGLSILFHINSVSVCVWVSELLHERRI